MSKNYNKFVSTLFKRVKKSLNAKALPHFYDISDALIKREKPQYLDGCHLSEQGNELVAARILQILESEYSLNK